MGTLSQLPGSSSHHPIMTNADLLCRIEDGVQLYYITPEGYVSAPSYPSSLSIYLLTDGHHAAASATNCESSQPAFLQVGDWIYPLLPEQSPVLHSNWGSYIFPDVASPVPGNVFFFVCFFVVTNYLRCHVFIWLSTMVPILLLLMQCSSHICCLCVCADSAGLSLHCALYRFIYLLT